MGTLFGALRGWFLTGLLVLIPTGVTFYLFWWAGSTVDRLALLVFRGAIYRSVPGAGLATVLILILLVGAAAKSWVGRKLVALYEWLLLKLPMLGRVFKSVRKIAGMIFDESSRVFTEVVLFEYPRPGVWSVGFVAAPAPDAVRNKAGGEEMVAVFVATSPNPTSGMLVFVRRADLMTLDMSAERCFELTMSGGLLNPDLDGE